MQSLGTAGIQEGSRNIVTQGTSIEDDDIGQEIVSMPTRAAAREVSNPSPLQWRSGKKDRVYTDVSDTSLLQLNTL